ncbi:ribonuclease D [Marinicella sediminis]|uniref:Ribonuclease D n=1 Tax=Marinicella sediminis TaxID=1792834 RepID=A0ABV7JB48_9GAMM|nr:hypothetical protein [Marinicella sediminis]
MTKILSNFIWVDDKDAVLNLLDQLSADNDYAVDTEFERSRTFYLNPALLQISCADNCYLVDIAIAELAELLLPAIKGLVLHSGSEDLELWYQVTGKKPARVFDTQVAAALCGFSLHTSYLNLVKALMDVELDKGQSRSDWLARPLSNAQLTYAVEDIAYLDALKDQLSQTMEQRGMLPLFTVLMDQLIAQIDQDHHNDKMYQKLVKAERLNKEQAHKLWLILLWRDQLAKQRNKPRNWILNPRQLAAVVRKVNHYSDLYHLGLHPKFVKLNGQSLIKAMADDSPLAANPLPQKLVLSGQQGSHMKDMKQRLVEVCERKDIDPAIIINTQALKKLAASGGDLESLPTWQALVGV